MIFLDLYKVMVEAAFAPVVALGDFWTDIYVKEAINTFEKVSRK
jgi:hypothetical protein